MTAYSFDLGEFLEACTGPFRYGMISYRIYNVRETGTSIPTFEFEVQCANEGSESHTVQAYWLAGRGKGTVHLAFSFGIEEGMPIPYGVLLSLVAERNTLIRVSCLLLRSVGEEDDDEWIATGHLPIPIPEYLSLPQLVTHLRMLVVQLLEEVIEDYCALSKGIGETGIPAETRN